MRMITGVVAALAVACAGAEGATTDEDDEVASLRVGLVEQIIGHEAFPGRSVKISGRRRTEPNGAYPCISRFSDVCLGVASTPAIASPGASDVAGLCPSANVGPSVVESSLWDFEIAVFEGDACDGAELTAAGAAAPITCYARDAIGKPGTENRILGEELRPGHNVNDVVCIVKPAAR